MTTPSKTDPADLDMNPKTAPADDLPSNTVKDRPHNNWTTGGETMTGAQASYLEDPVRGGRHRFRPEPVQGGCVEDDRRPSSADRPRSRPLMSPRDETRPGATR